MEEDKNNPENDQTQDCCSHDCVCCKSGPVVYKNMIDSFIAENGFAIIGVLDAEPPFAYTIGMTAFNRPELIIVGAFDANIFNNVLIEIGHRYLNATGVKFVRKNADTENSENPKNTVESASTTNADNSNQPLPLTSAEYESLHVPIEININNVPVSVPVGLRMVRKEFHDMLLGQALARYNEVECIQLIIPDSNGKLPWDKDFDNHWNYHAMQIPLYTPSVESCDRTDSMDSNRRTVMSKCNGT